MNIYICGIFLTELLIIAMIMHTLMYPGFDRTQKKWFILTFLSVMICAGAEGLVHCGVYSPTFAMPLTVITSIQFSGVTQNGIPVRKPY